MSTLKRTKQKIEIKKPTDNMIKSAPDNFEAAFILSAIGDALGWPTEFIKAKTKRKGSIELPITEFVGWKKRVGGQWWGYYDEIAPGTYSDDTQLSIAVARCINEIGEFDPSYFAYSELPLWLQYQRGGGTSVKTAARSLLKRKIVWNMNFYKTKKVDYRNAGANGAAMRNLPIILVNINNENRLVKDSVRNAIITHGHPRAIIGTLLFSYATKYALSQENIGELIDYVLLKLDNTWEILSKDNRINSWIKKWDSSRENKKSFKVIYNETLNEVYSNICDIPYYIEKDDEEYYQYIGALDPSTKGSGIATVCSAIYLYSKYTEDPINALYSAVNMLGSDTDTIAVFLGALLGSKYGKKIIPKKFYDIQDCTYLKNTANRLFTISKGENQELFSETLSQSKKNSYLSILAWELGFREMFWDAIDEGGSIIHPTLGQGIITRKTDKPVSRVGYKAKLLDIKFESGQTCLFHSRVQDSGNISESLSKEVMGELKHIKND